MLQDLQASLFYVLPCSCGVSLVSLWCRQTNCWEKLFFVFRQVTHPPTALFLESTPDLSPAFCPAHCAVKGWPKPFWLALGAAGLLAAAHLTVLCTPTTQLFHGRTDKSPWMTPTLVQTLPIETQQRLPLSAAFVGGTTFVYKRLGAGICWHDSTGMCFCWRTWSSCLAVAESQKRQEQ